MTEPTRAEPALDPPDLPGLPAGGETVRHFLVQAPVPAMDVDGFKATILGLVAFAVGSVVTGIFFDTLQRAGKGWWLGVCVSGFALGLIGLGYCRHRRARRRAGRWNRD